MISLVAKSPQIWLALGSRAVPPARLPHELGPAVALVRVWQSEGTGLKSPSRPIARRASTWSSERFMDLRICVTGQAVAKATGDVALKVGNV